MASPWAGVSDAAICAQKAWACCMQGKEGSGMVCKPPPHPLCDCRGQEWDFQGRLSSAEGRTVSRRSAHPPLHQAPPRTNAPSSDLPREPALADTPPTLQSQTVQDKSMKATLPVLTPQRASNVQDRVGRDSCTKSPISYDAPGKSSELEQKPGEWQTGALVPGQAPAAQQPSAVWSRAGRRADRREAAATVASHADRARAMWVLTQGQREALMIATRCPARRSHTLAPAWEATLVTCGPCQQEHRERGTLCSK